MMITTEQVRMLLASDLSAPTLAEVCSQLVGQLTVSP